MVFGKFQVHEENKKLGAPIGTIFMDSVFTPIKNVKYSIEDFRVEQGFIYLSSECNRHRCNCLNQLIMNCID